MTGRARRAREAFGLASACICGTVLFIACSSPTVTGITAPTRNKDAGEADDAATDDVRDSGSFDSKSLVNALCSFEQRCYPTDFHRQYANNLATCQSRSEGEVVALLAASGSSVTQAELDACASKLTTGTCADSFRSVPECQFEGTLDNGAGCEWGAQCKSSSCTFAGSTDGGAAECGTCTARSPLGGDCGEATRCVAGGACFGGKCIVLKKVGERCQRSSCEYPLECLLDSASATEGTCTEPLGHANDSCTANGVKRTCDPTKDFTCVVGDNGGFCVGSGYSKLGNGCGTSAGSFCEGGVCRNNVCVDFPTVGQPCPEGLCAAGLWCNPKVICAQNGSCR